VQRLLADQCQLCRSEDHCDGKLTKIERLIVSLEVGVMGLLEKCSIEQLAGSLLYREHGSEGATHAS
jgi:hypothetical protein